MIVPRKLGLISGLSEKDEKATRSLDLLQVRFAGFGQRRAINELHHLLVTLEFSVQWLKPRIDLLELVALWKAGKSYREIGRHFKVSYVTVFRRIKRYQKWGR